MYTMESLIMSKRKLIVVIAIFVICLSVGIISLLFQKQKKVAQAVKMYQEFIEDKRTVSGWDIKTLSTPTGEPERRVETKYTMVDVNRDGIPELHVYGARSEYVIFSVKDGEMYQFGYFQSYMCEYHPLKNGTFLCKINDRHDYGEDYKYFELNALGEPINEVEFSWVSRDTDYWTYQEKDIYEFDGKKCTYEKWYALTRQYLKTTVTGNEGVRNAAEWTRYCTFKE